jgi:hypothetical protein
MMTVKEKFKISRHLFPNPRERQNKFFLKVSEGQSENNLTNGLFDKPFPIDDDC